MSGTADSGTVGESGTESGTPLPGIAVPGEGTPSTGHERAATDFDKIAREKGWKPLEEFEGAQDVWVGPEEFLKRQPLFDKIKNQNKQLKELTKTVDALAKHYNTNIQQAKERAISELKLERRDAIQLGHSDRVDEIDKKIEDVKSITEPVANTNKLAPEIEEFVEIHKDWFNVDQEMTSFAVAYNESYLKTHPGDLEKSLAETLKKVKQVYPEKFTNTRRENPPSVETGDGAGQGQGGKYTMNRLSPEQKIVYAQLVTRHKQMSHTDYFKGLEDAGYLGN